MLLCPAARLVTNGCNNGAVQDIELMQGKSQDLLRKRILDDQLGEIL